MNSKLNVGAVYLYQDEWKILLSCSTCGSELDKLDKFLQHSLEHRLYVSPSNVLMLIEQLNSNTKQTSDDEEDTVHTVNDSSNDPLSEVEDHEEDISFEISNQGDRLRNRRRHLKNESLDEQIYGCGHCEETFATVDELTVHMAIIHDECLEEEPYVKEEADSRHVATNEADVVRSETETVLFINDLPDNMDIALLPENGEDPPDDIPVEEEGLHADDYEPIRTANGYKCALCNKVFKRYSYCRTHIQIHTNQGRFKCDICCASFLGSSSLRTHRQRHLGIKPFPCEHCAKAFHTASELKSHTRNIHENKRPYACPICGQYFRIPENLDLHLKSHRDERAYVCSQCDETFLTVGALTDHAMKMHGARLYRCTLCQLSFDDKDQLQEHCRAHNGITAVDEPEKTAGPPEQNSGRDSPNVERKWKDLMSDEPEVIKIPTGFQCGQCKKVFKRSSHCRLHIRTHTNYRPHKCHICGVAFKDKSNFNVHLNRHLGVKQFACKDCNKSFITTTELKLHSSIHSGVRPHVCTECGHSFVIRQQLLVHMRRHRNERPFVCTHCGQAYFSMADLREHELLHRPEPQFKCNVCEKAFGRKKTLLEHMRLHEPDKKYACRVCGMKFAQYTGRYLHMKKVHADE